MCVCVCVCVGGGGGGGGVIRMIAECGLLACFTSLASWHTDLYFWALVEQVHLLRARVPPLLWLWAPSVSVQTVSPLSF